MHVRDEKDTDICICIVQLVVLQFNWLDVYGKERDLRSGVSGVSEAD
jgi:hypothetical protein